MKETLHGGGDRQFDFALLARAAELSEGEAAGGVEELVRWRIFHQARDGFAFTHDRIREVAYDELLRPRRVLLGVGLQGPVSVVEDVRAPANGLGNLVALGAGCFLSQNFAP